MDGLDMVALTKRQEVEFELAEMTMLRFSSVEKGIGLEMSLSERQLRLSSLKATLSCYKCREEE